MPTGGNSMRSFRADPRVDVRVGGVVFGTSPDPSEVAITTRNLSASGFLGEASAPLLLGRTVRIRLDLTDESGAFHPIVLEALVLRVEGRAPWLVAFHFVNPPARIRNLLKRFVFSRVQNTSR